MWNNYPSPFSGIDIADFERSPVTPINYDSDNIVLQTTAIVHNANGKRNSGAEEADEDFETIFLYEEDQDVSALILFVESNCPIALSGGQLRATFTGGPERWIS